MNSILPSTANAQTNSFFPDFARGGSFVIPEGFSNYNGLQIDLTRRWQHDLTVDANYTYSKCLGDARDILDNDIGGYRAPYVPGVGIAADYGLCDIDVRNIFHASGTYELPFGHGQALLAEGLASAIAGGWSLQGVATVQEGQPFTIACTTTTTAGLGCNALKVPGQNPYAGAHNATHFLNPAAFANPATTATGVALLGGSPTQVIGPAYRQARYLALPSDSACRENAIGDSGRGVQHHQHAKLLCSRYTHFHLAHYVRVHHQHARQLKTTAVRCKDLLVGV